MDRPPDDPSAEDPAEAEPEAPAHAQPDEPAPESPREPDATVNDDDLPTEAAASSTAPPWESYAPPEAGAETPPGAAPSTAYPPVPPAPDGQIPSYAPPGAQPEGYAAPPAEGAPPQFATAPADAEPKRPGVGPGVATGCGVQVLALILFFLTAGIIPSFYGALWPFILFTVAAALLLISKRWRRFATGALIVCAATWIVVLGPCIALIQPMM